MSQVNYQTLKHSSAPAPIHWDATLHYKIKSHHNSRNLWRNVWTLSIEELSGEAHYLFIDIKASDKLV